VRRVPTRKRARTGTRRTTTKGNGPAELLELIEISHRVGSDPDLVQGGGGNTSVKSKDGKTIFLKASGTALGEMTVDRGWAELELAAARGLLQDKRLAELLADEREAEVLRLLEATVKRPRGARPSVESSLHAILGRVVIHTHPVGLNAFLCSRFSRKRFSKLIGDTAGAPVYVPYVDPGYTLGARLASEIEEYLARYGKLPAVVLLENHGLFVSADNAARCLRIHHAVTEIGKTWIGGRVVNPREAKLVVEQGTGAKLNGKAVSLAELRGALLRGGCAPVLVRRDDSVTASEFIAKKSSVSAARQGAFTPDQIVYCRTHPLVLDGDSQNSWTKTVAAYRQRYGLDPRVVLRLSARGSVIPNGAYYAAPDLSQLQVVSEVYRSAMTTILRNGAGGGPRFLNRDQARFIESWEVEKFRATLLAGASRQRTGCIGLVTGAASGLGKAIATGLVEAGATVLALDVDRASLETISSELPRGRYLPCTANVTDEDSVASAFRALEASTGGIDFLVNAAGIAPSFPLVEFPLDSWKRSLDINLTGYFLCAREAARVLLRQGAGGSIINLTSKSGLEASKENSAYNATKAGEIHLMRGWALELGKAGIRVNCVAPGNVFKGSRIWNDKYIRACAKKKGIRPKDVIPHYTSLTALNKEIEPEDVVAAVLYLVSEEARRVTGQTLVVDGGQVMVR